MTSLSLHQRRLPLAFDHRRYLPVVLTRQGERHALRELDADVRSSFTPLFVVHPIDRNLETGEPKRTVEQHLDKLARDLARDWGTGPAFVDLRYVDVAQLSDRSHPIAWFMRRCGEHGLPVGPVVYPSQGSGDRAAALRAAAEHDVSVCVRLSPADWIALGSPLGDGALERMLSETTLPLSDVHIVLDVEDQIASTSEVTATAVRQALRSLPHSYDFASVTVAGTGMPSGTGSIGADGNAELPRLEWLLWRMLRDNDYRRPSFGDYCVQHPDPMTGFDPRYMDSAAQLRYTTALSWLVVRGRGVKARGNSQIHDIAAQVVANPDYSGRDFSWGDAWIADCADKSCGPGNQGVWRKATTNHHLTYVVRQLASPGVS